MLIEVGRTPSTMDCAEECESNISGTKGKAEGSVIVKVVQKPEQKPIVQETPKVAAAPVQTTRIEPAPQRTLSKPAAIKVPVAPVKAAAPVQPSRVLYSDMNIRPLPRGDFQAVAVAAVQDEKLFTIFEATAENTEMLESIGKAIEAIADKNKAVGYKPQSKEVVLALFEGVFYRAVCQKALPDGSFEVRFIDYGNVSTVKADEIVKFDDKKVPKDVFVHQCVFTNLPDVLTEAAVMALSGETIAIKGAYKEDGDGLYTATVADI